MALGWVLLAVVGLATGDAASAAADACTQAGSLNLPAVKMSVVNESGRYSDDEVFVALTGVPFGGYANWGAQPADLINRSVPLSCLPEDPVDPSGRTHTFLLGRGIGSGRLWISLGQPITSGLPTVQPSPDTTRYRFSYVEFTYPGVGDVSNVDDFTFPIDLQATDTEGNTVTFDYSADSCTIVGALRRAVTRYNDTFVDAGLLAERYRARWEQIVVTDDQGHFVRVLAPKQRARQVDTTSGVPNPYAQGWPEMDPYIESLAGRTITVDGLFTPGAGSPAFGQTGWYRYRGTFDATGDLTLAGTIGADLAAGPGGSGSVAGLPMTFRKSTVNRDEAGNAVGVDGLGPGIYDQNSQYSVGGQPRNGWTNGSPDPAAPNDVYNSIYRDLISAFTYGYWGSVYGNNSRDFWRTFSPPGAPSGGRPAFADARHAGGESFQPFSIYSDVLFRFSDHYNMPYGENYGTGAPDRPSPLVDIPPGGEWRMTIRPDGPAGCLDDLVGGGDDGGGGDGDGGDDGGNDGDVGHRPDLLVGLRGEPMIGNDVYAPDLAAQTTRVVKVRRGRSAKFLVRLENDGDIAEVFGVEAPLEGESSAPGRRRVSVTFATANGTDVTNAISTGSFRTKALSAGAGVVLRMRVLVGSRVPRGTRLTQLVTAAAEGAPDVIDEVAARVRIT